jgi:hypothetical protein
MPGHGGKTDLEGLRELLYRDLARSEVGQDCPPGGIGKGPEDEIEVVRWGLLFNYFIN